MRKALAILLLVSGVCRADLNFQFVDGADVGIGKVLKAHKAEATAAGKNTWLWGSVAWTDPSGSYAYFTFHGYGSGVLFKRNDDGSYAGISPAPPDDNTTLPSESRPIVVDVNNNGYMDILHTGDETPEAASLLNNGDGTWTFSRDHRVSQQGVVVDANDDGYPDIVGYRSLNKTYPMGSVRTAINLAGQGFEFQIKPITLPAGCPQEVVDRVSAASDRFHMVRIYDLDDSTYIVTYGGAYGGQKFTYTVRNNRVVDIGLPQTGMAHKPLDIDGDGNLDLVVQYSAAAGIYRQNAAGEFLLDESGDMPTINEALSVGSVAYKWDVWPIDLDQDGDTDLVLSNKRSLRGYILDNRNGVFGIAVAIQHVDGEAIWPGDADGDGDIDIIVAGGGNSGTSARNSDQAAFYINQLNPTGARPPASEPQPGPDLQPEPTPQALIWGALETDALAVLAAFGQAGRGEWVSLVTTIDILIERLTNAMAVPAGEQSLEPNPEPNPEPAPGIDSPASAVPGTIPLPDHDPDSQAWARWVSHVNSNGASASGHALLYAVTGEEYHCAEAIVRAQDRVDADTVGGNQYLQAGGQFSDVFNTLAWCNVPDAQASRWKAWGRRHLGETDGSVKESIWWTNRWSRNNPANNYYHSFIRATSVYAMATGDVEWLDWLREDRLPRMFNYYATTPEGGSREGTGYGESHRHVFSIAKLWRDYDGTEVVPQEFIDNSLRYWTHATTPGHGWVALIGDHTRTHGRTDGYHRDIIDNALQVALDPEAIAIGRWQLAQLPEPQSAIFYSLELRDYPDSGQPPEATEYHAVGAGHFFARDSWGADATYVYFTAGKHDEAHQQEDQGAYAVWARRQWQTTSDSPWTHGGIAQKAEFQNVLRFPSTGNIHGSVSTLTWTKEGELLRVEMDLTPAVGQLWKRTVVWKPSWDELRITDIADPAVAEFGFEKPSADDYRAPYVSNAEALVETVPDGFRSVIRW